MPYPPQGAGVANFLGLLDTPAAYTGEKRKAAVVNEAESAMEFQTPVGAGLEVVTEENFVLFGPAPAPVAWTNLQIADAGGNKPQGVALLEFNCALLAAQYFHTRANGETADSNTFAMHVAHTEAAEDNSVLGYAFCPTDENGVIQWRCNAISNVTVTLRAFITGVTFPSGVLGLQVFNGNGPVAWSGIDFGIGNALVILRVVSHEVIGPRNCVFRRYGDTTAWPAAPNGGVIGGISKAYCDNNQFAYVVVPTDGEGRIQWGDNAATVWTISLVCYIKNVTAYDIEIYDAVTLDQGLGVDYFQTIDLPMTKQGIAYIKQEGALGLAGTALRQTGLTALFPRDTQGCQATITRPSQQLQLTNEYGQVDLCCDRAEANRAWLMLTIP